MLPFTTPFKKGEVMKIYLINPFLNQESIRISILYLTQEGD